MFQIYYLYLWRHVIKMFNLISLHVGHIMNSLYKYTYIHIYIYSFIYIYMNSLYSWHSNVNKSFQIKIGSEQDVNSLKTTCFKGRPSMLPHYAETAFMKTMLLLFSHMNFTQKKISHDFNLPYIFFHNYWNVWKKQKTFLQNKQHGKTFTIFMHPNCFIQPNEIPFGLKLKRKLPPQSYSIEFERKWKCIFHHPSPWLAHTENFFRNIIKSTRNQNVFNIFRFQVDVI